MLSVTSGQNLLTEMYSAIQAEVPVDASTSLNHNLIGLLRSSDKLIVCGQALSHCVNFTVRDIVKHCPIDERGKISILTDCTSAVPGFDAAADEFLKDMKAEGVSLVNSSAFKW